MVSVAIIASTALLAQQPRVLIDSVDTEMDKVYIIGIYG